MRQLALALVMIMALGTLAFAEEAEEMVSGDEKMSKDEACVLLGNCRGDMETAAKTMLEQCEDMMARAEGFIEKGKKIWGQGRLWGDKEMEAEGKAIYDQGKEMYVEAQSMSYTCKKIIEDSRKAKDKYSGSKKNTSSDDVPTKSGDFIP